MTNTAKTDLFVTVTEMYVAFQLAAEACMIHDMIDENSWLHLRKNAQHGHFLCCDNHRDVPLAMLLVLADELSIWDRYYMFQKVRGDSVECRLDRDKAARDIEITVETDPQRAMIITGSPPESQNALKTAFEKLTPFKKDQEQSDLFVLDYRLVLP